VAEQVDAADDNPPETINRTSSLSSMGEGGVMPKFLPKGISLEASNPSVSGLSRPQEASGSGDDRINIEQPFI
jgi:hypothetical protein